jgi:hypothetical protein
MRQIPPKQEYSSAEPASHSIRPCEHTPLIDFDPLL